MCKVFVNSFILSEIEIKNAGLDLVGKHKVIRDAELYTAITLHKQKDTRSFHVQRTHWIEDVPMEGMRRYSRSVYLFLTNPEEAQEPSDLVWMPNLTAYGVPPREFITVSGKVLSPVGDNRTIWRLA